MTELQIRWYRQVVDRDAHGVLTSHQMLSIISQLNKVVNHPKQLLIKKDLERGKELMRIQNAQYAGILYYFYFYFLYFSLFGRFCIFFVGCIDEVAYETVFHVVILLSLVNIIIIIIIIITIITIIIIQAQSS
jgi:hypothetical protein